MRRRNSDASQAQVTGYVSLLSPSTSYFLQARSKFHEKERTVLILFIHTMNSGADVDDDISYSSSNLNTDADANSSVGPDDSDADLAFPGDSSDNFDDNSMFSGIGNGGTVKINANYGSTRIGHADPYLNNGDGAHSNKKDGENDEDLDHTEETPLLSSSSQEESQSQEQQQPFILETSHLSIFSSLTFHWFVPLLKIGNSKDQLDPEDLESIPLPPSCQTKNVSHAFEHYWNIEMEKYKRRSQPSSSSVGRGGAGGRNKRYHHHHHPKPSLAKCLALAYGRDFLRAGFLKLIHDLNVFVGPIVLHGLIQFLRTPSEPLSTGLLLTLAVTISQTIMSFCLRHYFFKCYLTGLRMRTAIVVQVYRKALVLSSAERQRRRTGEIINYMTVDAQRIQDLTTYSHAIWYSFLQIALSLYFLWGQMGVSCLGGVAVILFMVPLTKVIATWTGKLQSKLMKATDHRVEINNEVLGNMKGIKLQAWEDSFQKKIMNLRKKELKRLFYYVLAKSFSIMVSLMV